MNTSEPYFEVALAMVSKCFHPDQHSVAT